MIDSLAGYRKEWLRPDLVAGLTTAAVVVPKVGAVVAIMLFRMAQSMDTMPSMEQQMRAMSGQMGALPAIVAELNQINAKLEPRAPCPPRQLPVRNRHLQAARRCWPFAGAGMPDRHFPLRASHLVPDEAQQRLDRGRRTLDIST